MSILPDPDRDDYVPPPVVDGELVDLDALVADAAAPLRYPPAIRKPTDVATVPAVEWVPVPEPEQNPECRCGNVTERGHNGFSCDEVLAIRARVEYGQLSRRARRRVPTPAGWKR
jgi:hypothetical protein